MGGAHVLLVCVQVRRLVLVVSTFITQYLHSWIICRLLRCSVLFVTRSFQT